LPAPPPPLQSSSTSTTVRATSSPRRPSAPPPPTSTSALRPSNAGAAQKRHPTGHQNQNRKSPQAPPKIQGKHQQGPGHGTALKAPQLKKIPELLPIFVEMVSVILPSSNPPFFPPCLRSIFTLGAGGGPSDKFFYCLFFRCAPRYVHGDRLMDSLVILVLDQRAVELVYECNLLLWG
jgi:hypothetical protein